MSVLSETQILVLAIDYVSLLALESERPRAGTHGRRERAMDRSLIDRNILLNFSVGVQSLYISPFPSLQFGLRRWTDSSKIVIDVKARVHSAVRGTTVDSPGRIFSICIGCEPRFNIQHRSFSLDALDVTAAFPGTD